MPPGAAAGTLLYENGPSVGMPSEALDCFHRTRRDLLVPGDRVVDRRPAS